MAFLKSLSIPTLILSVVLLTASFTNKVSAQDGKALFSQNCASCHAVNKRLTGPALAGVEDRWGGDRTKLHAWVHNSAAFLKTGDAYANNLYNEYNKTAMNLFPQLTDKEIDVGQMLDSYSYNVPYGLDGDYNIDEQKTKNYNSSYFEELLLI